MNTPKDSPGRIRAGIEYCVAEALEDGDCWVEYEDLLDRANHLLVMDDLDSRELIEGHLEGLIREHELVSSPYEVLVVAKPEIEEMERELAGWLLRAAEPTPHFAGDSDIDALVRKADPRLNAQQQEAVVSALRKPHLPAVRWRRHRQDIHHPNGRANVPRPRIEGGLGGPDRKGGQAHGGDGGAARPDHSPAAAV